MRPDAAGWIQQPLPYEEPDMTTAAMKIAYLKKDRQERYNSKRGWFVNAYRLVDIEGNDMVQPWFNTKTEARQFCKIRNWKINETLHA